MSEEWRDGVRTGLEVLVDQAIVSGATQKDVLTVLLEEFERLRIAYQHDPDPADDLSEQSVEEPSNEWPAAGRQPI